MVGTCDICGQQFYSRNPRAKRCSDQCRLIYEKLPETMEATRRRMREYQRRPEYKLYAKEYRKSSEGKEVKKKGQQKYMQSAKGKESLRKYEQQSQVIERRRMRDRERYHLERQDRLAQERLAKKLPYINRERERRRRERVEEDAIQNDLNMVLTNEFIAQHQGVAQ